MSYSKPGDTRTTATAGPDGICLYEFRYAGICGPIGNLELPNASSDPDERTSFTIEELTAVVEADGWKVVGTWRAEVCYDGIRLEAEIERA